MRERRERRADLNGSPATLRYSAVVLLSRTGGSELDGALQKGRFADAEGLTKGIQLNQMALTEAIQARQPAAGPGVVGSMYTCSHLT